MDGVRFIICIHNHQPVGNFDYVIEDAYQRAYLPFLDVMERHREIPWVLHNSGCLWEWLESHHPEYIDRIAKAAAVQRIELLGGGFYEPVLPSLTPDDRKGQIQKMKLYLRRRFGVEARGLWLTERVWEPDLPLDLVDAGVSYLPLDDTQLHQIGMAPEAVRGSYYTESAGRAVRIFPALMSLRYKIPYSDPDEAVQFLRDPFPGGGDGLALYADDGEKFGIWPGSFDLLYRRKWLERFLTGLEKAADRIKVTTFSEEMEAHPPDDLIYLPTGSYAEMGEWSLPAEYQRKYELTREKLIENEMETEADLFVKGGFWRNFFARYPESSWMHMRALEASGRCRAFRSAMNREAWQNAQDHFWRAQCNCAYWHGIFGGLYLPHLRAGIYKELINGENYLARYLHGREKWVATRETDLDIDGHNEVVVENDQLALYLDPNMGGRLLEWDDRSTAMNLINVLSRRPENYHRQVLAAPIGGEEPPADGDVETIHGALKCKDAGLADLLTYDWYDRAALTDHVFNEMPTAKQLIEGEAHEIGDFVNQIYDHHTDTEGNRVTVRLWRDGGIWRDGCRQALRIEKTVSLTAGERSFTVAYRYQNLSDSQLIATAAVESHFNLLVADAPDRYLVVDGRKSRPSRFAATGELKKANSVALVEGWQGWHLTLAADRTVGFCRYPVETVSLSEAGAERNFQGLAMLFHYPLDLAPGAEFEILLTLATSSGLPEMKEPRKRTAAKTQRAKR
jgi:4-alpha-glucanotransferase